ncbi:MAG: hypothetical protein K6E34_14265 [Lachnospiraceae bacterium]|nr:hypothetical protein [Lachnospiraceae bacterium]
MIKNLDNLEKSTEAIHCGEGGYLVNKKHIIIRTPDKNNVIDIQEYNAEVAQGMSGRNIALYGMACIEEDKDRPGITNVAANATLINEGIIEIYINEMVKAYKDQIKANKDDDTKPYNFIRCYTMVGGRNCTIINEGILRIHLDQEDEKVPVYVFTTSSGEKATVINNGTLELVGKGSFESQLRAMTIHSHVPTIINNGRINIDVEESSTIRVLATTKTGGAICNFGEINVKSSGKVMTIGRMADTNILNEGEVNVDFKAHWVKQNVSFLFQSDPLACAIYEHCPPGFDFVLPPIVNTGDINVDVEGSEASTDRAVAFGIYTEMIPGGEHTLVHRYDNTGRINVTHSGMYDLTTAELGINYQAPKDLPFPAKILRWDTVARDFSKTKDLILAKSVNMDLSEAVFGIKGGEGNYSAEDLVAQTDDAKEEGQTFTISGADSMKIENLD